MTKKIQLSRTKIEAPPFELLGAGAEDDYNRTDPDIFVPSGIAGLDAMILGAVNGEMVVIGAEPSQGKTSMAVQWGLHAANNDVRTAMASMEMSRRSLRNRVVSSMTGLPMSMLRKRDWASAKHKTAALQAADLLNGLPFYVDERSGLDGDAVYNAILGWKAEGIEFGIVDYLQLMAGANESRVTQVGDAVRAVKAAAKATDIPIILVSSMNRGNGTAMSRLRDSGDIEFAADTIIMLEYPNDDETEDVRVCNAHIKKQRNGPTGIVPLVFNRTATRFEDYK